MFKRCVDFRNRRRSRQSPKPPQQETQPSLTALPLVVVGSPVSAENTDMPVT
ncbi:unnamed protein product [Porites lobata]|uniref:Uncharacterized protein n=1 Tax=Porites lobata TaxID=104759 RepID=A0ABN8QHB2_9CNID|nr:unnamed protein product [Porites lobata]